MKRIALVFCVAMTMLAGCEMMKPKPDKSVWFVEPKDGATVTSPFKVVFGVKGMALEPAGEIKADSGHHHLLINLGPMAAGEAIPVDDDASALRQGADRSGDQAAARQLQADDAVRQWCARLLRATDGGDDQRHGQIGANRWRSESAPVAIVTRCLLVSALTACSDEPSELDTIFAPNSKTASARLIATDGSAA